MNTFSLPEIQLPDADAINASSIVSATEGDRLDIAAWDRASDSRAYLLGLLKLGLAEEEPEEKFANGEWRPEGGVLIIS